MTREARWQNAQSHERMYYQSRSDSLREEDRSTPYAVIHEAFWKGILSEIPSLSFAADGTYCDVGCGPNSILAYATAGTLIAVDPLMEFYKENFTLPSGIDFHQDTIESLGCVEDASCDAVFIMNCIDHVEDIDRGAAALQRKLKPGGLLIVSVNVMRSRVLDMVSHLFDVYKLLDPKHPYHFTTPGQLTDRFTGGFDVVTVKNIQHLNDELEGKKRQHATSKGNMSSRFKKFVKERVLFLNEDLYLMVLKRKV